MAQSEGVVIGGSQEGGRKSDQSREVRSAGSNRVPPPSSLLVQLKQSHKPQKSANQNQFQPSLSI